jgi:hypothetical protein
MENEGLETHLWGDNSAREIQIGGKAFVLYHCPRCTRFCARTWPVGLESRARRCPQGSLPARFLEPRVGLGIVP